MSTNTVQEITTENTLVQNEVVPSNKVHKRTKKTKKSRTPVQSSDANADADVIDMPISVQPEKYVPKHIFNLQRERDHVKPKMTFKLAGPLPKSVDLRTKCPPVFDQGQLGSCTANALTGTYEYDDPKCSGSRLFLYYNERMLDGDISDDAGSTISQGVNALEKYGLCSEKSWPYDINNFTVRPPPAAYVEGKSHEVLSADHVQQSAVAMKGCLASGYPIALGIQVYPELESDSAAQTGIVPMPQPGEDTIGGHAIMVVGYNDAKQWWVMRNSWGADWGDHGYFYLPYAYLTDDNLASDLWRITKVEIAAPPAPHPPTPIPNRRPSIFGRLAGFFSRKSCEKN